jgi:hypothetical protein
MNDLQKKQLALIISCSFEEIRNRCQDRVAVADLAYASHNLAQLSLHDDFSIATFKQSFASFHEEHGFYLFDFVAMLSLLEAGNVAEAVVVTAEQRAANPPKWHDPTTLPETIHVRPARF